ncbi:DUF11 domain-containing protein, partial [Lacihabitans sp. CCS-44]|uniref:SdrD B-like domain-containing protein n=1 Tax=Lacihabitans sp. CCS-44 TaxID=2487331 RepID=UPI0020CE6972
LAAAGTYTLTVTSASGCTTTATVAVTVNACLSKIGDFVWEDINGNGIQDSGEPGIPGVSVTLNGTDAFGNVVSQTATTGANGEYLFDNLVKGTYTVTFGDKAGYVLTSPNKGTDDAKDSDADLTTKQSPVINLGTNASNLTIDAGMYRPASLGDFVWYDINNNGIQDSGEPGIQGVVVTLNGTKGDGTVIAAQTSTTNASGIYAFTNLAPGTYTVTFGTVGGYQVAKQDITGANTDATDVNNDSDINSTTLTSHAATLVSGENDPKLDAGFTKVIDLELDKTVSNPTPNVGETVTYTLKLTNKGPQIATGVALEDVIPNGLENIILTATNSPQGVIAGNKITFSGLTVNKDQVIIFTYTAKVKSPIAGVVYKNVAQVTAANEFDIDSTPNNDDGDQSEDDEDPETIVPQQADLNLVKTVNNATPNVGEKVTFTVKVSNDGPSAATGVQVKDLVPNGYETISAISNSGTLSGSEITWSNLSIPNGQFVNLTFDAIVKVPGTGVDFVNVARVTASDQFDNDSKPNNAANTNGTGGIGSQDADDTQDAGDEDDGDDAKTTPKVIDLELDKTVSTATPNVGETITYTLKLTNKGPNTATGVALEDIIPNGLENITLTATNSPQGVIAGNKITFSGLTVLKDETKTFTYTAKVKEPLTGVVYKNVAQVTASNEYDIDSTPNNDDGDQSEDDEDPETIVPQVADLSLVKTVDDKYPKVGDVVTFTVKVSNAGPQTATNVKVEDVVPNGYSAISSISNSGSLSGNVITWVIPSIASGASSTLTFNVKVGQPATGVSFINLAEVKSVDQYDPDSKPGNGADTNGNGKVGSEDNDDSKDPADEDDGDDAYVVPTASLGDFVWDDINGNGIQDGTEIGVQGVIVNLFGTDQDGNPVSRTTTTDANGKYLFDDLVPGSYFVEFIRPTGYTGSDKDQGTDDTKDSDADKITGKTGTITLAGGDNNLTVDAGIFKPAKLGDYVWEDKNYNGIQDSGESPIQGVVVKLLDAAGNPAKDADGNTVASTTTDAAGLYKFENLKPGVQYVVEFTKPAGYEPTSKDKGTDDTKDSDADVTTGKAAPVVLASGEDNKTIDAG